MRARNLSFSQGTRWRRAIQDGYATVYQEHRLLCSFEFFVYSFFERESYPEIAEEGTVLTV